MYRIKIEALRDEFDDIQIFLSSIGQATGSNQRASKAVAACEAQHKLYTNAFLIDRLVKAADDFGKFTKKKIFPDIKATFFTAKHDTMFTWLMKFRENPSESEELFIPPSRAPSAQQAKFHVKSPNGFEVTICLPAGTVHNPFSEAAQLAVREAARMAENSSEKY